MISNRLTTIEVDGENVQTERYSNHIQQFSPISANRNITCDDNIPSIVSTTIDSICQKTSNQSTHVPYHLLSKSKGINRNSNLRKQIISDSIDYTKHQTIHNQLDAINFLQDYLKNGNSEILIDLLHDIARELKHDEKKNYYSTSAINNNHLDLTPMFNTNLQLSNNKEKKNKKEKSAEKEIKEDKKKENIEDETVNKKSKKSKEKTKKVEQTSTTDSDSIANSPSLLNPIHKNLKSPKSSSYSPTETIGFPSLSIPVPQSGVSPTNGLISPDSSHIHISQPSNIAQLSQVQHQLQTDPQSSSLNKTTFHQNISIQQQLQSLSQMAHDGDEVLITLNVNTLTQKQELHNNNVQYNPPSFQNNLYSSQPWNQIIRPSTGVTMPRHVEIVAKGFVRVQNEHPQPSSFNLYPQQSTIPSYNQLPFVPRYPMACYSNSGPPQIPIGPPIQPILIPPHMRVPSGFNRPLNNVDFMPHLRNNFDNVHNYSHKNSGKCDYLCQSSLNQPDFRGRPAPNQISNPTFTSINFSAKQTSKHKTKTKSKQKFF